MIEPADSSLTYELSRSAILGRYVLCAIIASLCNLAAQEVFVLVYPLNTIVPSMIAGTAIGFFVKYLLDKRWVFLDRYDGHISELKKFFVYGLFGVVTTIVFWAIELMSWHLWQTSLAKYAGASIGLLIGHYMKYSLDRAYVFNRKSQ